MRGFILPFDKEINKKDSHVTSRSHLGQLFHGSPHIPHLPPFKLCWTPNPVKQILIAPIQQKHFPHLRSKVHCHFHSAKCKIDFIF